MKTARRNRTDSLFVVGPKESLWSLAFVTLILAALAACAPAASPPPPAPDVSDPLGLRPPEGNGDDGRRHLSRLPSLRVLR